MGQSSYDRVYELIMATKEGQTFEALITRRINTLHVDSVEFEVEIHKEPGASAVLNPVFNIKHESDQTSRQYDCCWDILRPLRSTTGDIIGADEVKAVLNATFGVNVPTFGCKKEVATGDKYRKHTNTFRDFLNNRYRDRLSHAKERLTNEIDALIKSEKFAQMKQEAMVKCALRDISAALAAYRHLGKDVLRQAIQEFIIEDVFEYQ